MKTTPSVLRTALIGFGSLAIAMGIGRFAFTPLLPMMQDDSLLTIEQGGVLASVHFAGYLLGAIFATRLAFSPRTAFRLSLITIALTTLGMGLAYSFVAWLVFRFAAGFASALVLVLVSNFYVKHLADRGASGKQGLVFSGVGAGIAVAGLGALATMAAGIGSAASWQIFGLISLLLSLLICAKVGPEITEPDTEPGKAASRKSPLIWGLIIPYGALGLGYIIPATYLPVMAKEIISSPLVFGWAWPLFGTAALASTLLAAALQRHFSIRQIWVASQAVMAFGLLMPAVYPHILSIIAAGICVGGTFMVITMMGLKETHRLVPAGDVMRHLAIMTAAFAIGQMLGPVLAGLLFSITESFSASLVLASLFLVATAITLILPADGKQID